ncbi:hypothetical protein RN001_011493 [Aquatica leii]|uniref:S1 motif domain-containing protein n=1 Tax=Aquatica leii TaxID=1421715 RepID=A0AAN7S7G0_9COLE|nr:hypothetical protein RN001_011493 [Aquatica leii]
MSVIKKELPVKKKSVKRKHEQSDSDDEKPQKLVKTLASSSNNSKTNCKPFWEDYELITGIECINDVVAKRIIKLFDDDNTIPFIARYRKDVTGGLTPNQLHNIKEEYDTVKKLKIKIKTAITAIEKLGKMSPSLKNIILGVRSVEELEYIYAPFKPGTKRTLAERAKALGLEKPALALLAGEETVNLTTYVKNEKELNTLSDVEKGIMHIIASVIATDSDVLSLLRKLRTESFFMIECKKSSAKKDTKNRDKDKDESKFTNYFDYSISSTNIKPHQILAINRGESLKMLSVKVVVPDFIHRKYLNFCTDKWTNKGKFDNNRKRILQMSIEDGYTRLLQPHIIREVRAQLKLTAEKASYEVFATNLKQLLLMSPTKGKVILGVDPGFTNGCQLALISESGTVLTTADIFPHSNRRKEAENTLINIMKTYSCTLIALGNGTACRETETWLTELIQNNAFAPLDVVYTIVNESGASIYSCGAEAKKEFGSLDPKIISAVSLARRVQEPLAELVKVEPKHLGVGMYQHDLPKKQLEQALDDVISECVSFVGVDINTASQCLLRRIAGLSDKRASSIISFREENGMFKSRTQLKNIKGIGAKIFEQCAGFLRVGPANATQANEFYTDPLTNKMDCTYIHPESYEIANKIIKHFNLNLESLGQPNFIEAVKSKTEKVDAEDLSKIVNSTVPTIKLIINALSQPLNFDLRSEGSTKILFKKGLTSIHDLKVGCVLTGSVSNCTHFGCFVDVGVGCDGLIHSSKMKGYSLQIGDKVEVKVVNLEINRKRIGLEMISKVNYLDGATKKCLVVQDTNLLKDIYDLANLDVTTQDFELQQVVFSVLNSLLKYNLTNKIVTEVPAVYLRLAFDVNVNHNEAVQNAAYDCLDSCLKLIIANNICDVQPLFLNLADKTINNKVSNLLCKVYSDLSAESAVVFFYKKNVCAMFESSNIDVRRSLIKINNQLLPKFNITLLSTDNFDKYKTKVRYSYIPRIMELMTGKDINWSNLFKFILKCFGKLLHTQVDLINDLLKAVEMAFRSFNLEDRFQAFECWKELIDNYSLDMNRLCRAKQMKLLITPLKTNISTNDHIVYKRFEVWVHLFNILQDKSFVCLEKFLQFCFGTNAGVTPTLQNDDGCCQNGQLYEGSTQALLEIMGHYQHTTTCFLFPKLFLILNEPLVNDDNFLSVERSVVHSVDKCSTTIMQWMSTEHVSEVIRCLWGSLFNKVKSVDEHRQEPILKNIIIKLQSYVHCTNSTNYFRSIVTPILELLMKDNFFSRQIFTNTVFFPLIKCLLDDRVSIPATDNNVISDFIKYGKNYQDIDKWLEQAYNIISNGNTNFHNALLLWMECTDVVFYLNDCITPSFPTLIVDFMMWPLTNKEISSPPLNFDFIKKWKSTIRYVSKMIPLQISAIIEQLQNLSSQENAFIICLFYKVFCQMLENDNINSFETALVNLTQHMLESFTLNNSDVTWLVSAVTILLQNMVSSKDTSNCTSICKCCAILLKSYKKLKLLHTLKDVLDKVAFPQSSSLLIVDAINSIKDDNEEKVLPKIENVKQLINKNVKTEKPSPRGRKLIALTRQIPTPNGEPSSLLLLGQNVSSPNHVNIRGSHLKNEMSTRMKQIVNKLNFSKTIIIDDDDAKFAPIDTEYNFDPKKLTDHQLEVLKTRPSDIPALYQDLSQSQSNFGLSNSNSKLNTVLEKQVTEESKPMSDEERVNLCVENPSEEQIGAMIRNHDSIDFLKDIENDIKKRERVEKQLIKLKLDIVGGDSVQKIDLFGKRETRHKADKNFKQYKFLNVGDPTPAERPGTPSESKKRRRSSGVNQTSSPKRRTSVAKDADKPITNAETPKVKRGVGRQRKSITSLPTTTIEETPKKSTGKKAGRPKRISVSSDGSNSNSAKNISTNVDNKTAGEFEIKMEKDRSPTKISVEENLNFEEKVKEVTVNSEKNLQEAQSEDIIESSQKPQDTDTNNCNVIDLLNSEYEEIVTQVEAESLEVIIEENFNSTVVDLDTCNMDTETVDLCNGVGTPPKSVIEIPTSPIQTDTPTRTSEFINNTVDISPIKLLEDSQKTQELFESETITMIPIKTDCNVQNQVVSTNDIQLTFFNRRHKKIPSSKTFASINRRSNKMITSPVIFSAQTHRIMKMMQKCEKKLEFHKQVNEEPPTENLNDDYNGNQEFLKFVRVLPSPKASPGCSILKRKACEIMDEGLSPPRKKRVNFCDPPLTSKMMYVPDVNEHNHLTIDSISLFDIDDTEDCEVAFSEDTQLSNTLTQGSVSLVDVQLLNSCDPVFKDLVDCEDDIQEIVAFLSDPLFASSLLTELQIKNIKTVGDLAKLTEVEVNRLPIKSPKVTTVCDALSKHKLKNGIQVNAFVTAEPEKNEINNECDKPDIVQRKQKRRVPLKAVTASDCSNESNFKPLLLEPVTPDLKAETEPEVVLNKLIQDLNNLKLLTNWKRANLATLLKLLLEIMDPNELLKILQDNAAFRLSSLIEEKDWPQLLKEVITKISLKKFVSLLCSIPEVSSTDILQMLIDESMPKYDNNNFLEVGRHICRVIESSSPSVILKHLTLERIIEETFHKCNDSKSSTLDFFKETFRVFAPTIDDIIPSFQYINVINLQNQSAQRNQEDLLTFIQRILTIVDTSKVCLFIPKEKMLSSFTKDELVDNFVSNSTSPCDIIQTCERLVCDLPQAKLADNTYQSLVSSLFSKIPLADLCRYFSNHLNKFADTVQNAEQL